MKTETLISKLGLKADLSGIDSLSPDERTIIVAWSARGIIGNGGFQSYFRGAHPFAEVIESFGKLGLGDTAKICAAVQAEVARVSPLGWPAFGHPMRAQALDSMDWDRLGALEIDFYTLSWEALERAIADFVAARPKVFGWRRFLPF